MGLPSWGGVSVHLAFPMGIPDGVSSGMIPDGFPSPAAGIFPIKWYWSTAFHMG